jgi:hypothetical protein
MKVEADRAYVEKATGQVVTVRDANAGRFCPIHFAELRPVMYAGRRVTTSWFKKRFRRATSAEALAALTPEGRVS